MGSDREHSRKQPTNISIRKTEKDLYKLLVCDEHDIVFFNRRVHNIYLKSADIFVRLIPYNFMCVCPV